MDPQQQQAANALAGLGMGAIAFVFLFFLAITVFFVFLFWRIFTKAGLAGPLALLTLVPGIGFLIVLCILAFSRWNVATDPAGYIAGQTAYPPAYPPQAYPPANYPPPGPPPTQL